MTGISLALDGSENNLFRNDKQALEAAQGEDDDEPEDAEVDGEDPFKTLDSDSELED